MRPTRVIGKIRADCLFRAAAFAGTPPERGADGRGNGCQNRVAWFRSVGLGRQRRRGVRELRLRIFPAYPWAAASSRQRQDAPARWPGARHPDGPRRGGGRDGQQPADHGAGLADDAGRRRVAAGAYRGAAQGARRRPRRRSLHRQQSRAAATPSSRPCGASKPPPPASLPVAAADRQQFAGPLVSIVGRAETIARLAAQLGRTAAADHRRAGRHRQDHRRGRRRRERSPRPIPTAYGSSPWRRCRPRHWSPAPSAPAWAVAPADDPLPGLTAHGCATSRR